MAGPAYRLPEPRSGGWVFWSGWCGLCSFPPRRLRPLPDVGESRRVAASTASRVRPSSFHLVMVPLASSMNAACSSGVALLQGTDHGLYVEKPSRPAIIRAVLRLHGIMPNLSPMRLASILAFQLPRPNPLSDGGPSRAPLMRRSCSGAGSRGLPGPPGRACPRDPRAPARTTTGGRYWDGAPIWRPSPRSSCRAFWARPPKARPRTCLGAGACTPLRVRPAARREGTPLPSLPALPLAWGSGG